jgi:hypothetical protein
MRLTRERLLLLVLLVATAAVWYAAWGAAASGLLITVLDVGQGDCLLVQAPSGRTMLVDGGGLAGQSGSGYDVGGVAPPFAAQYLRLELGFLWGFVPAPNTPHGSRELELAPHRQGLVARLFAVAEDARGQQALLDHRLGRERAGELVAIHGPVVAVEDGASVARGDQPLLQRRLGLYDFDLHALGALRGFVYRDPIRFHRARLLLDRLPV